MTLIAFTVNREDIYGATRRDDKYCPIARAITRRLNNPFTDVSVTTQHIMIDGYCTVTPERIKDIITRYDGAIIGGFVVQEPEPMKPFAFALEFSSEVAQLIVPPIPLAP